MSNLISMECKSLHHSCQFTDAHRFMTSISCRYSPLAWMGKSTEQLGGVPFQAAWLTSGGPVGRTNFPAISRHSHPEGLISLAAGTCLDGLLE